MDHRDRELSPLEGVTMVYSINIPGPTQNRTKWGEVVAESTICALRRQWNDDDDGGDSGGGGGDDDDEETPIFFLNRLYSH